MKPRGGHLCFDLVAARHNETLGEKIESAHDCKTDETATSLEIPQVELEQILFPAALPPRLRTKGCFHWSNAVT